MPFDIADWKRKIGQSLKAFKADIRREGPGALYYGLCATALLPLAQAVQTGGIEQASGAAIALAGAVGGNLLANLAQKLADTSKEQQDERAQQGREQVIAQEAAADERVADALDAMLAKLNVIEQTRAGLSADDKAWFTEALQTELKSLGSSLTINAQGSVIVGDAHMQQGDFVARDKIVHIYGKENVDWARYYLQQLMSQCNRLPLGEMGDREGAETARDAMTLDQVYVTLNVARHIALIADFERTGEAPSVLQTSDLQTASSISGTDVELTVVDEAHLSYFSSKGENLPARSAIARSERIVLHGAPGSGKSAFVRQLAADLCAAQLEQAQLPGVMRPMRELCPVITNLRELAQKLKALSFDGLTPNDRRKALQQALWAEWESELTTLDVPDFKDALRVKLLDGKALLIFDGLDEVAPDLRPLARDAVLTATKIYARPPRVIVTVRTRSFDPTLLPDFDAYELLPFGDDQISDFSHRWYAVQAKPRRWPDGYADDRGNDLATAARGLPEDLASNPLLLTVIAIVHQDQTQLPHQRVKLYDKAIEVLLKRWQRAKGRDMSAELQRMLDEDFRAQGAAGAPVADLTPDQIVALLSPAQYFRDEALAREFLGYVDEYAGLLVGNGGRDRASSTYSFPHRTFQEYLAGRYMMTERRNMTPLRAYREKAGEGDYWERAAQLGAEAHYYGMGDRVKLLDLIYQLCPQDMPQETRDWRAALWSADMAALDPRWIADDVEGAGDITLHGGEGYLTRARQRLIAIMRERKLPAIERATAGRALAKLGDPRDEVMTVEKMVFVHIPAGPFLSGEDKQQRVIEHPFWITQYPITNSQFDQFVQDDGYTKAECADWWREAAELGWWQAGQGYKGRWDDDFRAAPERYREPFDLPNHPVVGASWHEALAFTRWLNTRRPLPSFLGEGQGVGCEFRLPTEWEWERAARGEDGRTYPWGEEPDPDLANYNDTRIGATSAVGCFPRQAQWPNDCEDISGNVDERTLSKLDEESERICGGAWSGFDGNISLSMHFGFLLGAFGDEVGFRVVYAVVPIP